MLNDVEKVEDELRAEELQACGSFIAQGKLHICSGVTRIRHNLPRMPELVQVNMDIDSTATGGPFGIGMDEKAITIRNFGEAAVVNIFAQTVHSMFR